MQQLGGQIVAQLVFDPSTLTILGNYGFQEPIVSGGPGRYEVTLSSSLGAAIAPEARALRVDVQLPSGAVAQIRPTTQPTGPLSSEIQTYAANGTTQITPPPGTRIAVTCYRTSLPSS